MIIDDLVFLNFGYYIVTYARIIQFYNRELDTQHTFFNSTWDLNF